MKRDVVIPVLIAILFLYGISTIVGTAYGLVKPGEFFPEMFFDLASNKSAQRYLEVKGAKKVNISEIDADVLIFEVLNVYCVSCMAQAPFDRELFSMIRDSEKMDGKVKMIGVGVGNNQAEVSKFIAKHKTPYPVFIDPKFVRYDQIGQVRTPFKIFLKRVNNKFLIVKTELGVHKNVEETFRTIVDILEGRYPVGQELDLAATEKKSIDRTFVVNLLKEWMEKKGEPSEVKELFEDAGIKVYGVVSKEKIFAILINRVSVCDVCKDVQFLYMINSQGNVIDIIPIQLTKKYNIAFTEDEVAKIKKSLISRNVNENIEYDSEVDAISSATITTGIIYNSINKGSSIYSILKEKGFIK